MRVWALVSLLGVTSVVARAQTNAEINAGIQFNFSVPGARSLGAGGAFLGLADDATAAYANPAGLTTLSEPEVSIEARAWSFHHEFTDRGRLSGQPTGQGIDTLENLRTRESDDQLRGLSFLSMVYPRNRWAVALYRHELAHFDSAFETQGAFLSSSSRLRPARHSLELEIVNTGVSAAFQCTRSFSLGAGLSSYDLDLKSLTRRYDFARLNASDPGDFLGPASYASENVFDIETQEGKDRELGVNVGFTWAIGEDWRIGGVYRQGPELEFKTTYRPGPRRPGGPEARRDARFNIPDVLGLGVAYQPSYFSTISLDYIRIGYSELAENLTDIIPRREDAEIDLNGFRIDDGDEIHLGYEYIFAVQDILFAARLGAWHDPDHKMRYVGENANLRALFLRGEDEIHYSAGLGFISGTRKYQVDFAFDLSDRVSVASLSAVARY